MVVIICSEMPTMTPGNPYDNQIFWYQLS